MSTTLQRHELCDTETVDDQISRSAEILADYVPDCETDFASATAQRQAERPISRPLPKPTRRRWSISLSALLVLVGGLLASSLCLYQAKSSWRPAVRPIQDYRVGQAVRSENPTGEEDLSLGDHVDPPTWRHLVLKAPKTDGSYADVELLRPLWWLEEREAKVGEFIDIDVPHCGIEGEAEVLAIKPCPPVEPSPTGYRTVTGTFHHHNAEVIDLYVEGLNQPIGTTPNHPFWSEDRQEFVRADDLKGGESLKGSDGNVLHVRNTVSRNSIRSVFNLEVAVNHAFLVTSGGILVHNGAAEECWKVGEHGKMPSPRPKHESHHGVMSRWMKAIFGDDYKPGSAPAVLMPKANHRRTVDYFNTWKKKVADRQGTSYRNIDWESISEQEMRELGREMFKAARTPKNVQQEYWKQFDEFLGNLQNAPKPN